LNIFVKLPVKIRNFSEILPGKSISFVKLPEKIEIFQNFFLGNRIILPGSVRPPDFKPDWRHSKSFCDRRRL